MTLFLSKRGETLVETLASILVCTFALIMLLTAASVATSINSTAYEREMDVQRQHAPAERHQKASGPGVLGDDATLSVSMGGKDYTMDLFGGEDLRSYELLPGEEG